MRTDAVSTRENKRTNKVISRATSTSMQVDLKWIFKDGESMCHEMLSTSPWGDGVGMNRAAWDAVAGSSGNNVGIDPSRELQSLPKVPTMPLNPLMGGLGNQGMNRALQDNNGRMPDGIFDGHGVHAPHHLQPWNQPYLAGIPPTPPTLSRGKSDTYLLQGEGIRRDVRLGKRVRDEEDMLLEGHPENMVHLSQNAGLQSGPGYGDPGTLNEDPAGTSSSGAVKPRVRARRGQATDPHSIAERNRRERIAERMRALQELVPDSNKTDKASMLDEIIGYVKFLQMQVKCLSMCRLGGAGAAAVPLLADLPIEGASNFLAAANLAQAHGGLGSSQEGMALAERQVAQLMDEDMSAAMQYLQSKGLCLMPISLATAISSTGVRQQSTPTKAPNSAGNGKQGSEAAALTGGGSSNVSLGKDNMGKAGGLVPKTTNDTQKDDNAE